MCEHYFNRRGFGEQDFENHILIRAVRLIIADVLFISPVPFRMPNENNGGILHLTLLTVRNISGNYTM